MQSSLRLMPQQQISLHTTHPRSKTVSPCSSNNFSPHPKQNTWGHRGQTKILRRKLPQRWQEARCVGGPSTGMPALSTCWPGASNGLPFLSNMYVPWPGTTAASFCDTGGRPACFCASSSCFFCSMACLASAAVRFGGTYTRMQCSNAVFFASGAVVPTAT